MNKIITACILLALLLAALVSGCDKAPEEAARSEDYPALVAWGDRLYAVSTETVEPGDVGMELGKVERLAAAPPWRNGDSNDAPVGAGIFELRSTGPEKAVALAKDGRLVRATKLSDLQGQEPARYSAGEIRKRLESQGIECQPVQSDKPLVLNGIRPAEYQITDPLAKMVGPAERVAVYIFKSSKEREKGLADFNRQKAKYDMAVPLVWEDANAMVFYWHHSALGEQTVFGERIQAALPGWFSFQS